jgi:transposase-like protein
MVTGTSIKTLQQAIIHFADYDNCRKAVMAIRWPGGTVACPTCGSTEVSYLANARLWKCYEKHPKAKFSLKVGTIFEDSPIPLQKWFPALWMLVNCKNGISSYELGRALGVTQKSAWFMLSRLRLALQSKHGGKLGGTQSKRTKHSSAARPATCTATSAVVSGPRAALSLAKWSSWACWNGPPQNVRAKSAGRSWRTFAVMTFTARSRPTSNRAQLSAAMRSRPTSGRASPLRSSVR